MRDLIRPALFIAARLGLFLSVVWWFVCQWNYLLIQGGIGCGVVLVGVREGIVIGVGSNTTDWVANVSPYSHKVRSDYFTTEYLDQLRGTPSVWLRDSIPGFVAFVNPRIKSVGFIVRYKFIVTIFALFNGVLMWLYRKRGEEISDE